MARSFAREAVGVFDSFKALRDAADELMVEGFHRSKFSLLAGRSEVAGRRGKPYADTRQAEDDPDAPIKAYEGTDSRSIAEGACVAIGVYCGALIAAIVGGMQQAPVGMLVTVVALAGVAGGAVGALGAWALRRGQSRYVREQLAGGGMLLWVNLANGEEEAKATDVLRRHGASDVHVHELPHREEKGVHGVSREQAWVNKPLFGK